MKFIDILTESEMDRLYKKAELIYRALKTGEVTSGSCKVIYTFSDDMDVKVDPHNHNVYLKPKGIKIKETSKYCKVVPISFVIHKIKGKFKNFNIALHTYDIDEKDIEYYKWD